VKWFLARFEEIAMAGPAEDKTVLESMVCHEASILRWIERETEGQTDGSLDDINSQLRYPLPAPVLPT